ncbi:MAG TPA: c-type cytochrome [Flavisolibacter sp.]|nr:c-type cytochrome [Flavisolibacter sp.]
MTRTTTFAPALLLVIAAVLLGCVDRTPTHKEKLDLQELTKNQPEEHGTEIKPEDVQITTPLNAAWVTEGKNIYDVKCQSCHKLTEEKLVGPGWKGVTTRRQPHWIMNMITNVDMMLETDPEAQRMLEECLVRMPNQNLTKDESRKVVEFMRRNDGVQ